MEHQPSLSSFAPLRRDKKLRPDGSASAEASIFAEKLRRDETAGRGIAQKDRAIISSGGARE